MHFIIVVVRLLWSCIVFVAVAAEHNETILWKQMVESELNEVLKLKWNTKHAKNVILFVGDGMGPNTVTATRIYKYGEEGRLSFEKFPHVGLLKTYCNNMMVPDSASTATALFAGVKVNYETAGVDGSVALYDCEASLKENNRLKSILHDAQDAGMKTGFITTMRVTHATPSALYAHTASRKWECETRLPPGSKNCKDIARQLIEDEPGRNINIIMGGGRQCLITNTTVSDNDPKDVWSCERNDGKNLIETWKQDKENRMLNYAVVQNNEELDAIKINETDYVLGIFGNGHMKLEHERDKSPTGIPSLTTMTETAIKILENNNQKGYFLMIEGGNIDMSHHRGKAKKAINEAASMDDAVDKAIQLTNFEDTLIIVTSDHGHTLSINGYAKRGSDIFGLSVPSKVDKKNYTVLTYATGGEESIQFNVAKNENGEYKVDRRDPSQDNTTDFEYSAQAAILVDENTHSGSDVIVYAKGPHGHLFHNIHEQHYVAHAIRYAAGIGEFTKLRPNNSQMMYSSSILILLISTVTILINL